MQDKWGSLPAQCTEDEHDDEDENDSQISEFGFNPRVLRAQIFGGGIRIGGALLATPRSCKQLFVFSAV